MMKANLDGNFDERMMRRALQLARCGAGFVSPNPMVGAVVTDESGKIIGEGYHRRWGGAHAEVNALAAVADKSLLSRATVYVTLEPCSHYGKTPPCAKLLIDSGVKRVVVGVEDPFPAVSGRGIQMLRDAGIEVTTGVLAAECRELNHRFMTAHTLGRAYVVLKWAQSADGFISAPEGKPIALSTPLTQVLMHKERSLVDAIMVGSGTVLSDNPSLTCRLWPSRSLRPVVADRRHRMPENSKLAKAENLILFDNDTSPLSVARRLYVDYGMVSVMVEGGAALLQSFIDAGIYDEIRVEISSVKTGGGVAAPQVNSEALEMTGPEILCFRKVRN